MPLTHAEFLARNGHLNATPAVIEEPPPKEPTVWGSVREDSLGGRLLLVARDYGKPITPEMLAVRAWEAFPEAFGLRGFERLHPDNNKVNATLCGSKGLVARGFLRRLADGRLEVGKPPQEAGR